MTASGVCAFSTQDASLSVQFTRKSAATRSTSPVAKGSVAASKSFRWAVARLHTFESLRGLGAGAARRAAIPGRQASTRCCRDSPAAIHGTLQSTIRLCLIRTWNFYLLANIN